MWEQELSAADGLFNTVVELVVGQNANLRFVSAQGLDEKSWVFGAQRARVARDAELDWVTLGFGATLIGEAIGRTASEESVSSLFD